MKKLDSKTVYVIEHQYIPNGWIYVRLEKMPIGFSNSPSILGAKRFSLWKGIFHFTILSLNYPNNNFRLVKIPYTHFEVEVFLKNQNIKS